MKYNFFKLTGKEGINMFKIKKFSALSISVLLSITTLFSCSFTDREKVDFVKEEKIHELSKMKDLISSR